MIYEILIDSNKHTMLTGAKAEISREIGGSISAYDGFVEGENIQLKQDKKIVQKWRGKDWPEEHFSIVTFELEETKEGTRLNLTQTNVPEHELDVISDGWYKYYWEPMKKLLEGKGI